jgi:hypothetical protein
MTGLQSRSVYYTNDPFEMVLRSAVTAEIAMHRGPGIGLRIQVIFGGAFDREVVVINSHDIRSRGTRLAPTVCAVAEGWLCANETLVVYGNCDGAAVAVARERHVIVFCSYPVYVNASCVSRLNVMLFRDHQLTYL